MVVTPPTPPVAAPSPTPAPTPPSSLTPAYGPAFKPLVPVWGVVGQPFKLALSQYFRGAQGEQTYFLAGEQKNSKHKITRHKTQQNKQQKQH